MSLVRVFLCAAAVAAIAGCSAGTGSEEPMTDQAEQGIRIPKWGLTNPHEASLLAGAHEGSRLAEERLLVDPSAPSDCIAERSCSRASVRIWCAAPSGSFTEDHTDSETGRYLYEQTQAASDGWVTFETQPADAYRVCNADGPCADRLEPSGPFNCPNGPHHPPLPH
jgi:hypothetical protein